MPLCDRFLDGFICVTVDDSSKDWIGRPETFKRARLGKFLLPLFEPGSRGLLPIEGSTFPMNNFASPLDKELCLISR